MKRIAALFLLFALPAAAGSAQDFVRYHEVSADPVSAAGAGPERVAQLKRQRDEVWAYLRSPAEEEIRAATLTPVAGGKIEGGLMPKLIVQDARGLRYMFKPLMSGKAGLFFPAELLAMTLRRAADEPTVTVVAQTVKTQEGKTLRGYVKPMVPLGPSLPPSAVQWTPEQVDVVLADAVFQDFLGNYDSKIDQFIPVGNSVVNADWDHSGVDYDKPDKGLDRFKTLGVFQPPTQTELYQAYVRGKIDLDFTAMFDAVERIERIGPSGIREAAARFAEEAFAQKQAPGNYPSPDALAQAFVIRAAGLRQKFTKLVADLRAERGGRAGEPASMSKARILGRDLKDARLRLQDSLGGNPAIHDLAKRARALSFDGERE